MVLVTGGRLWCSLFVQSAGPRIEVLRFGLLLVLTVALLSVAVRIHSHSSSSASGQPNVGHPTAQPSARATPAPTPTHSSPVQVLPTASTRPPRAGGHPQTLPVTGGDATVKLAALAFVLIGAGAVTMRAAGPRRQRPETVHD
jgi:hypothetical protein